MELTATGKGGSTGERDGEQETARATTAGEGAGWRGWVLVGVVTLALLVVPGLIYWRPPGLPFRVAFLVLPLLPAFLLGATAVWVAVRGRRG